MLPCLVRLHLPCASAPTSGVCTYLRCVTYVPTPSCMHNASMTVVACMEIMHLPQVSYLRAHTILHVARTEAADSTVDAKSVHADKPAK